MIFGTVLYNKVLKAVFSMTTSKTLNYIVISVALFICLVATCLGYAYYLLKPIDPTSMVMEKFVVLKGSDATQIGENLEKNKFIKSALLFRLIVMYEGLATQLQAGTFDLSRGMTTLAIAQQLTKGTEDAWVTIQEGWRKEEIAESLVNQGLLTFDSAEFLELAQGEEGVFFPDTYLVPKEITAQSMYALLKSTFDRKVIADLKDEIDQSDFSSDQIIVLASLLEREAQNYEDMRLVSGILRNRLALSMPLQIDATLQYAKGYSQSEQSWWPTPYANDKKIDSPFNTYLVVGLPPRPISNPGLSAIKAALLPTKSNYLYYIHDAQGVMYVAETLEQHNANVNKYLR